MPAQYEFECMRGKRDGGARGSLVLMFKPDKMEKINFKDALVPFVNVFLFSTL